MEKYSKEENQKNVNVIGITVLNVQIIIIAMETNIVLVTLVFLQETVVVQITNAILAKNVNMEHVNIMESETLNFRRRKN